MDFVFTILLAFVVVITIYTIILVKNKLDMKDIDCRKNMIKKNTTGTLVPFTTENVSLKDCIGHSIYCIQRIARIICWLLAVAETVIIFMFIAGHLYKRIPIIIKPFNIII